MGHLVVYLPRPCLYHCLLFVFTIASSLCQIRIVHHVLIIISSHNSPSVAASVVMPQSSPSKRKCSDDLLDMPPPKRCKCHQLCQPSHQCTYGNYSIALEQVSNFIHGEFKCKERDVERFSEQLTEMKSMYQDSVQRGIVLENRLGL